MNPHYKYLAAHVRHALIFGKGNLTMAHAYTASQTHWADRELAEKAIVTSSGAGDFGDATLALSESFIELMRPASVPLRLTAKVQVPPRTQVLENTARVAAAEIDEGGPVPVVKGTWAARSLTLRKFSGIHVETGELARSRDPGQMLAQTAELAAAVAAAENLAFCNPSLAGSVFYGAVNRAATGSTLADIKTDFRWLFDSVSGSYLDGVALVMSAGTVNYLLSLDSNGAPAFPDLKATGGTIYGTPVLIAGEDSMDDEGSPSTRRVGLIQSRNLLWADGLVELQVSGQAAIQMLDNPTNDAGTATATTMVSLWQADAIATKAIRESAWHIRSGGSAYITAGY